MNKNKH